MLKNKTRKLICLLTEFCLINIALALSIFLTLQANANEVVPRDFDWNSRKPTIYQPKFPIKVLLAPKVKHQIDQSDAGQKAILNSAISTANAFMQQHLDGTAYDFDPDYLDWTANTGPLVALHGAEWERQNNLFKSAKAYEQFFKENSHWSSAFKPELIKWEEGHSGFGVARVVCSKIKLIDFKPQSQGSELIYETKVVANIVSNKDGAFVSTDRNGSIYIIRVFLSSNRRVMNTISEDVFGAELYSSAKYYLSQNLNESKKPLGIGETVQSRKLWIKRFQEILDLTKPAGQICG